MHYGRRLTHFITVIAIIALSMLIMLPCSIGAESSKNARGADQQDPMGDYFEGTNDLQSADASAPVISGSGPAQSSNGEAPAGVPDLLITASSISNYHPAQGSNVTVGMTVKNGGAATASYFYTSWYISTDSSMSTTDYHWGYFTCQNFSAGTSGSGSYGFAWPASKGPGTYYVSAMADSTKVITESNEGNNWGTKFTVTVPVSNKPDLYVYTSSMSNVHPSPGSLVNLNETVKNKGLAAAGGFYSTWYISTDSAMSYYDYEWNWRSVSSLGVGGYSSHSGAHAWPSSKLSGTYYVALMADDYTNVAESNEGNNWGYKFTITVTASSTRPDLYVYSSSLSNLHPAVGGSITLSDTIKNKGTARASAFYGTWFISTDSVMSPTDYEWTWRSISYLSPGVSSVRSAARTWPSARGAGTYYVALKADDTSEIPESNESNNWGAKFTVTVTASSVSAADLLKGMRAIDCASLARHDGLCAFAGRSTSPIGSLSCASSTPADRSSNACEPRKTAMLADKKTLSIRV